MDSQKTTPLQTLPTLHTLPTDAEKPVAELVAPSEYVSIDPALDRHKMIADAAYYRARQRGFEPGYELEDWLAAENEIVRSWLEKNPPPSGN